MLFRKRLAVIVAACFVVTLFVGISGPMSKPPHVTAQSDAAPQWEASEECGFHVRPDMNVDCGYLVVPQVRGKPEAGTIRVHVAIWRTQNPTPEADPVLFIGVGPGVNTASLMAPYAEAFFAPFLQNRDLIMVDQRGSGYSQPKLDCPAANTFYLEHLSVPSVASTDDLLAESAAIDAACLQDYLTNGADLEGYHTLENAADMRDLVDVLGYEQVNLLGVSYGTRVALTVMRDYPTVVRSTVLDSIIPIEVNFFEETPIHEAAVLDQLFAECAAHVACSASFPDLETDFYALLTQLDENPAHFEVSHPWTMVTYDVAMDGQAFLDFVNSSLGKMSMIPAMPIIIDLAAQGDFSLLTEFFKVPMTVPAIVSDGANLLTWCTDQVQFADVESLTANIAVIRPELQPYSTDAFAFLATCQGLPLRQLDVSSRAPAVSDIPTLLLSGPYDSFAPTRWSEQAVENLSNSRLYVIAGGSNGLISVHPCADFIAMQHFNNPTSEIDDSCVAEIPPVDFIVYE